jgi:hypothetical protein
MWQQPTWQQPNFQTHQQQITWSGGGQPCPQLIASGGSLLAQSSAQGAATPAHNKIRGRELDADARFAGFSEIPSAKRSRTSAETSEAGFSGRADDGMFLEFDEDKTRYSEGHPCPFEGSTRQNSYPGYGFECASGLAWLSSCSNGSPDSMED